MNHLLRRFVGFSGLGVISFGVDLTLLILLTEYGSLPYIRAAALSFVLTTSTQYILARKLPFYDTKRAWMSGYGFFFGIGLVNLLITLGSLHYLVESVHMNYIVARIIIAAVVGVWNFIMNAKLTFKYTLFK